GAGVAMKAPGHEVRTAGATTAPTAMATEAATVAAEPSVTAKVPDPAVAVTPSATVEALPAEVELTVDGTPKVMEVWQGGQKIGTTAGHVKIKRAPGKVKLTFKAP